ncbi:uncharacterized protein TRAVEDRAFT_66022 [Trametes versicolor FP-101664 SS1]|uniref:uncharacterized protein n=1 Tax=Trametes versicolor (strain FP-101664) TaxID=717944 RepID=UPI00046221B0|nr:uncharacterized protein TRAVEDRAFT_66022 [Trametes versicolor FP-101664 SS1]EIW55658.1 hypothetical protein TRAVEDRAFT_66022 [Trametes versicolor FP-101664 SS1]
MFKTAARKIAHNTTMPGLPGLSAKQDLRSLQELITSEKAILNSLQKLSADFQRASEALKVWGLGEGEDLADTLGMSTSLLLHWSTALATFAGHEQNVRDQMKSVRSREEALDEMKRRRKSVFSDAEAAERKLSKMNPENKNLQQQTDLLNRLRDEIRAMDTDIMNEEAGLGDFKRYSARAWMGLKFGGLLECCEKGAIVGELGKLVISEISLAPAQPGLPRPYYTGHARTEFLAAEAARSVSEVPYSPDPNPHPSQRTLRSMPGSELPAIPMDRPMSAASGGGQSGYGPGPGAYPGLPQVEESGFNIQQFMGPDQPGTPQNQLPPVNEFGTFGGGPIVQTHSLNPAEREKPMSPRGGRFATFPVKAGGPRPPPGHTGGSSMSITNPYISPAMRDGDRAPSIEIDRNDESFASSVAMALGQFGDNGASGSGPPQAGSSRFSPPQGSLPPQDVKGGADFGPQRYSPPPPMYTPSNDLPSGAAPPNPPSTHHNGLSAPGQEQQASSRPQSTADEEEGLAYMSNDNGSNESISDSGDRRVRFGGVSDVDRELEKRHAEQDAAAQRSQSPSAGQYANETQAGRVSPEVARMSKEMPPVPGGRSPTSPTAPRIPSPPPPEGDSLDEVSLNAAAAREVSRELDALMMSSPPVSPSEKPPASPWGARPQIPSYPRQAVSPRPSVDQSTSGQASQASSPKLEGMYVRQRDRSASGTVSAPVARVPPPAPPPPEAIPTPASPTASNEDNDYMQRSIPNISRISPAPSSNGTPFRTPLETPLAGPPVGSLYNMPGTTGSNTSFSAPGGIRTISAAAFRRPVRNASGTLVEGGRQSPGLADTSPLMVKKRPLPSSPYPSPHPGANLQAPGGIPRSVSASGGPQYQQSGDEQGQRPLTHYRQDDDDFDYISAYTESAPNAGHGDGPSSPGYQQGRFATNLEDGNVL